MSAVNYNIRLDKELRDEAFAVLDSYGLSPSQAFKLFLKQVAGTGVVPLSFDYAPKHIAYESNPLSVQAIKDARNGDTISYDEVEDMMTELNTQHTN